MVYTEIFQRCKGWLIAGVLCLAHTDSKSLGPVFSYKLRYIVGFWLVEMAISTNQKPTIYRNLYENTGPGAVIYVETLEKPLIHSTSKCNKRAM